MTRYWTNRTSSSHYSDIVCCFVVQCHYQWCKSVLFFIYTNKKRESLVCSIFDLFITGLFTFKATQLGTIIFTLRNNKKPKNLVKLFRLPTYLPEHLSRQTMRYIRYIRSGWYFSRLVRGVRQGNAFTRQLNGRPRLYLRVRRSSGTCSNNASKEKQRTVEKDG